MRVLCNDFHCKYKNIIFCRIYAYVIIAVIYFSVFYVRKRNVKREICKWRFYFTFFFLEDYLRFSSKIRSLTEQCYYCCCYYYYCFIMLLLLLLSPLLLCQQKILNYCNFLLYPHKLELSSRWWAIKICFPHFLSHISGSSTSDCFFIHIFELFHFIYIFIFY